MTYDIIIIGSGAGGLSTAISAKKHGLNPLILEKEAVFGGTTALSGGVLWVPCNEYALKYGDSREKAITYFKNETGNFYDAAAVEAFIDNAPDMVAFFERETAVSFVPSIYPDYHPDVEGGMDIGRSLNSAPFNATALGAELKRLKPPLKTITFMGMMFNSTNLELKHFFNATKSLSSAWFVMKRLASHLLDLARYGRGVNVTSGNALVARLAKSCFDLNIPILTSVKVESLIIEEGIVVGAKTSSGEYRAKSVVLACGGFPHDLARLKAAYPHVARGGSHLSPTPTSNTGDGVMMASSAGANVSHEFPSAAAWMPVSLVPPDGVFPHLVDRYKPGFIMVNAEGKRFTNETNSYHDVGCAMIKDGEGREETAAWLICDHKAIRKYGIGFVKPSPVPLLPYLSSGYLHKGETFEELATKIGISTALSQTVSQFNLDAKEGEDPHFKRGSTAFNRYLGDASVTPNPCIAPLLQAPFYAVKLIMGDLGSFDGLKTTVEGQVLNDAGLAIEGLYAVGNDRASIMGGNYPGAGITLGPILTFGYILGKHLKHGTFKTTSYP